MIKLTKKLKNILNKRARQGKYRICFKILIIVCILDELKIDQKYITKLFSFSLISFD